MVEIDSNDLRRALSQFATGVTIITVSGECLEPFGITANSFNSVSLDPPMVIWSLSDQAFSKQAFLEAEHFCVHVLTADQEELSERFARAGTNKFIGLDWSHGRGNAPLLTEYVARFQCRTAARHPVGDHIVFVGEVLEFDRNEQRPLVFHGGQYALAERRRMDRICSKLANNMKYKGERRSTPSKGETTDS